MKHLLLPILAALTMNARAGLEEGISAYNKGDYDTARKEFTAAADAKDPMGMHLLASLYYQGHGVEKDLVRAVALFEAAAAKGYRASQANLGLMYQKGDGVKKDITKAISYYAAAGKQGDLQSAFNLGQIYRKGDGVEKDPAKAAAYYKFAAERGDLTAMNEYGLLFAQGEGVGVDYVEAYGWISLTAKAGNEQAAKNLAQLKQILGGKLGQADKRAAEIEAGIKRQLAKDAEKATSPPKAK
ncbi:sel1 repeat family protein [Luteolibacter arcticus]|uniref:Sel1 repeat family protein n=1 Tax=Luteolibacter arcticus TaxID=1581411 RepID=A0ABT3GRU5_9BACT|nr:tetratricopeptide repeat protein [Luteolibacter arcticus]MCW1926256.1 sel1 repeat family protein [Luteolibacter arcticus]